jgi:hypothetical protein
MKGGHLPQNLFYSALNMGAIHDPALSLSTDFSKIGRVLQNEVDPAFLKVLDRLHEIETSAPGIAEIADKIGTKLPTEAPPQLGILDTFRAAFTDFGRDLPAMIFGSLKSGGVAGMVGTIAGALGHKFSEAFAQALTKAGGNLSQIGGGAQALGLAGMGISTAIGGFQLGQQFGKTKGALSGAASGALAGTMIMPGIGTAIGAGIGALAGFFGGRSADKKAREQMEQDRQALLQQFNGMQHLKEVADQVGVSIGNAFSTTKPKEFGDFVDRLNKALDQQKLKLEGVQMVLDGVNARATVFGQSLQTAFGKNQNDLTAQMKHLGISPDSVQGKDLTTQNTEQFAANNQGEFTRVSTMAAGAFGEAIATGSSPLQALEALKPTMDVLVPMQQQFNFSLSEGTQRLFEINAAVQANLPTFQALTADGQILNGMLKANWGDMATLAATSADVGVNIQGLIDRGMPLNQALALNQPTLQALWQAQQQFGFQTDKSTQALIDQAVTSGIVGPQMLSPQDKMLEVLGLILEQLGGKIPEALNNLPSFASNAANGVNQAFANVHPTIRPNIDLSGLSGKQLEDATRFNENNTPKMAAGGIVRRPTLALIGESGPEAVVPLSKMGSLSRGSGGVTVVMNVEGSLIHEDDLEEYIAKAAARGIRLNRGGSFTMMQAAMGNA